MLISNNEELCDILFAPHFFTPMNRKRRKAQGAKRLRKITSAHCCAIYYHFHRLYSLAYTLSSIEWWSRNDNLCNTSVEHEILYLPRREMYNPRRCARCRTGREGRNECESRGIDSDRTAAHPLNSPEFGCSFACCSPCRSCCCYCSRMSYILYHCQL